MIPRNMVSLAAILFSAASTLPVAAQDSEYAFVTARGHFDRAASCANVDRGVCEVVGNLMVVSWENDIRKALGRGAIALKYRPFAQCPHWQVTSYFELEGIVEGVWDLENPSLDKIATISGTLSGESTALLKIPNNEGGCSSRAMPSVLTGTWEARIHGLIAEGTVSFVSYDTTTVVPFLLDVADSFDPCYGTIDLNTGCPNELDCEHFDMGPKGDTGMSAACGGRG